MVTAPRPSVEDAADYLEDQGIEVLSAGGGANFLLTNAEGSVVSLPSSEFVSFTEELLADPAAPPIWWRVGRDGQYPGDVWDKSRFGEFPRKLEPEPGGVVPVPGPADWEAATARSRAVAGFAPEDTGAGTKARKAQSERAELENQIAEVQQDIASRAPPVRSGPGGTGPTIPSTSDPRDPEASLLQSLQQQLRDLTTLPEEEAEAQKPDAAIVEIGGQRFIRQPNGTLQRLPQERQEAAPTLGQEIEQLARTANTQDEWAKVERLIAIQTRINTPQAQPLSVPEAIALVGSIAVNPIHAQQLMVLLREEEAILRARSRPSTLIEGGQQPPGPFAQASAMLEQEQQKAQAFDAGLSPRDRAEVEGGVVPQPSLGGPGGQRPIFDTLRGDDITNRLTPTQQATARSIDEAGGIIPFIEQQNRQRQGGGPIPTTEEIEAPLQRQRQGGRVAVSGRTTAPTAAPAPFQPKQIPGTAFFQVPRPREDPNAPFSSEFFTRTANQRQQDIFVRKGRTRRVFR